MMRLQGVEPKAIEVERKFRLPAPALLQGRVAELGGSVLGEVRFTDSYFDTPDCKLTRQDAWLRQRDGAWEFKIPVGDAARSGGERTVFRELETVDEIRAALAEFLPGDWSGDFEARLQARGVAPFATFTTTRSKARLGSVGVDADVADFGLAVLELEVMCADAAEVPGAEAEILRVAELLGAEPLGETGGKLVTYIKRYCPGVFAQLVEARILKTSLLGRLSRFVQRFRRGRSVHT